MTIPVLPPLKPLPIKDRISVIYVERGNLDVIDGACVVVDKNGVRTHIPIGSVACLMLEPGARVSHAAVVLAARVGCLLVWIAKPVCVCMLPVSRAGHARIVCYIRPDWRWMIQPV